VKHGAPPPPPPPAVVDAESLTRALTALRRALGKEWVFDASSAELAEYVDAYEIGDAASHRPLAALLPANVRQIQKVLEIARLYKLPLWPLSTARNLGYGGAAPRHAGALMLSLKRMNRIVEVNEELAYAVVEPGVSYLDLHAHLRKSGSRLWLDPSASGWGGPLGNFLERGVGYTPYGQRHRERA
jgi:4-cresol dehydrogenase (hydroxylating)